MCNLIFYFFWFLSNFNVFSMYLFNVFHNFDVFIIVNCHVI